MKIGKKVHEKEIFKNFIFCEFLESLSRKRISISVNEVKKAVREGKVKLLRKIFDSIRPGMYDISFTKTKKWREAEITKREFRNLRVINTSDWRAFFSENRRGTIGGLAVKIRQNKVKKNQRIRKILKIADNKNELRKVIEGRKKLVILRKRNKRNKIFYSILEGNHRAVALALSKEKFKFIPVYLGIEK